MYLTIKIYAFMQNIKCTNEMYYIQNDIKYLKYNIYYII